MDDTNKLCSACQMTIPVAATRCGHCRMWQPDGGRLHRGGDRLVAGVCGAIAAQLGMNPTLVRLAFAVAAVLTGGAAFGVYSLLWVVTPATLDARSPLTRWADKVGELFTPHRAPEPSSHDLQRPSP